jgi:hypothetical protein
VALLGRRRDPAGFSDGGWCRGICDAFIHVPFRVGILCLQFYASRNVVGPVLDGVEMSKPAMRILVSSVCTMCELSPATKVCVRRDDTAPYAQHTDSYPVPFSWDGLRARRGAKGGYLPAEKEGTQAGGFLVVIETGCRQSSSQVCGSFKIPPSLPTHATPPSATRQ